MSGGPGPQFHRQAMLWTEHLTEHCGRCSFSDLWTPWLTWSRASSHWKTGVVRNFQQLWVKPLRFHVQIYDPVTVFSAKMDAPCVWKLRNTREFLQFSATICSRQLLSYEVVKLWKFSYCLNSSVDHRRLPFYSNWVLLSTVFTQVAACVFLSVGAP